MTLVKIAMAQAAMAAALFSVSSQAVANTESALVNKGDLGISLYEVNTNSEGKGDCACDESLYGSSIRVSGFHQGYGDDLQTVIITPAAALASEEIAVAPVVKTTPKKLKRLAMQDSSASLRRKAVRLTACVFGAPNASGCKQN